jgi:DNA-binding NarL/FixJ family response regulator
MRNYLVGVIENYPLYRPGIKLTLEATDCIKVIGIGKNAYDLAIQLDGIIPHIIVIDMFHCNKGGISLIKITKHLFPSVPLLLITTYEYSVYFSDYLKNGSKGFIFPTDNTEEFIKAITDICDGKEHFRDSMKILIGDKKANNTDFHLHDLYTDLLTGREMEVLNLFCDGLTHKQIGMKLFISARTVETHKRNIMSKLKVKTSAEMIKCATWYLYSTS